MSNMDIELDGADQAALSQANAAIAANDSDTSEVDEPFESEEQIQAEIYGSARSRTGGGSNKSIERNASKQWFCV